MTQKRKATEILLNIEGKIEFLQKQIQILDNNLKLLMNNNSLYKEKIYNNSLPTEKILNITDDKIKVESKIIDKQAKPLTVETVTQVPDTGKTKIVKPIDASTKKQIINQKISYASDSKNVILAKITAFDNENNLAGETKTGMTGMWKLSLRPGKYRIHINKSGTKTPPRPTINMYQDIEVFSDKKNKLENLII